MKVKLLDRFRDQLEAQVRFIARDKPDAASKFRKNILSNILKLNKSPFSNRPSIYFDDDMYRDFVYRGYKVVYQISEEHNTIFVIGLVNMQQGSAEE